MNRRVVYVQVRAPSSSSSELQLFPIGDSAFKQSIHTVLRFSNEKTSGIASMLEDGYLFDAVHDTTSHWRPADASSAFRYQVGSIGIDAEERAWRWPH